MLFTGLSYNERVGALRRASCCFADKAYETLKLFAIGEYDRAVCQFDTVEALYHYIQMLRCEPGCSSSSLTLCFTNVRFDIPINNYSLTFGSYPGHYVFGGDHTPDEIAEDLTDYFPNELGISGITVTASDNCFTFTTDCGNTQFDTSLITLTLGTNIPFVSEVQSGYMSGASTTYDICLDRDSINTVYQRITDVCGCCTCHDKDYELTNDTI